MGPAQSSLLGLGATAGVAASKISQGIGEAQTTNKGNNNLTKELKSQLAEMKSNQGIIEEYSTIRTNLRRARNLPTWNEKKAQELAFAEAMIEKFSKANDDILGSMKNTLKKEEQ